MKGIDWYEKYWMPGQKSMIRKDRIKIALLCFGIGIVFGYSWHFQATHRPHQREIRLLQEENDYLKSEIQTQRLEYIQRLCDIEAQLGICKGKNKRIRLNIKK